MHVRGENAWRETKQVSIPGLLERGAAAAALVNGNSQSNHLPGYGMLWRTCRPSNAVMMKMKPT